MSLLNKFGKNCDNIEEHLNSLSTVMNCDVLDHLIDGVQSFFFSDVLFFFYFCDVVKLLVH